MAIGNPITLTNNVASKITSVTATADQTLFTVTGGYRINQLAVFRNGVRLAGGADFTANDGASVTLLTAANNGDTIEFQVFDDFRVADAIVSAASTQTIFGDIVIDGDFYYTGSSTGIVTTITAGDNISVNQSTGSVVITGLANTANVVADTLKVTGISTLGIVVVGGGVTVTGVSTFYGDVKIGTGITLGASSGIITATALHVGTAATIDASGVNITGVITARSGINVTGDSDFNDGTLYVDSVTNRIGIGTTAPTTTGVYVADIRGPILLGGNSNQLSLGTGEIIQPNANLKLYGGGLGGSEVGILNNSNIYLKPNTGGVDLYYGKTDKKLETSNEGINVSGIVTAISGIVTYYGDGSTLNGVETTATYTLGADGTSNYTFTGPGLTGAENDPTIYLTRGKTYKFVNGMGAHPFRIQSTPNGSTGTQYNDGITNNDVSNGTLTWDVQFDAPDTLYYQCTSHPNMGGIIYIGDQTRVLPEISKSSSYTLIASDSGKFVNITSGDISVPSGIFSTGALITIYNNKGSTMSITASGTTLRKAGTSNTGTCTIDQYGTASILCVGSNEFVVSGNIS